MLALPLCACGCGKSVSNPTSQFCRGHCSPNHRGTPEQRFWKYIQKTETCWLWIGATQKPPYTYGLLNINRKLHRAHRLAWTLLRGPIPEGIEVCHNCPGKDNPLCVNPDHLFLGTHKDNMHDAKNKGRIGSKLTEADIQAIRTARPLTTLDKLAAQYGLNKNTICEICTQRVRKYTR